MINYFSQIIARNNPSDTSLIMPAKSSFATADQDPFQENLNEGPAHNSAQQNSSLDEATPEHHQTTRPLPSSQSESNFENTRDKQSNNNGYFSRHVERMQFSLAANPISAQTNTGFSKSKDVEALQPGLNTVDVKQKNFQFIEQEPHKNTKKSFIKATAKKEVVSNTATVGTSITKLQPAQSLFAPSTIKNHKPASKLVIGKITVEVIQPTKPSPPRIINRVIEAPSSRSPASNKLSFGLGQL